MSDRGITITQLPQNWKPPIDFQQFVQQYRRIEHEAISLIPTLGKAQLSQQEWERIDRTDFTLHGIDEEGISFVTEYNDSCHCHPEYQKAYVRIKWEDIQGALNE